MSNPDKKLFEGSVGTALPGDWLDEPPDYNLDAGGSYDPTTSEEGGIDPVAVIAGVVFAAIVGLVGFILWMLFWIQPS